MGPQKSKLISIEVRLQITWKECQTTRHRSPDSAVGKRTKNNLYDIKSWVHKFSGSFGLEVDKRTRGLVVGRLGASCLGLIVQGGELSGYPW